MEPGTSTCVFGAFFLILLSGICYGQVSNEITTTAPFNTTMADVTTTLSPADVCRSKLTCYDCVNSPGAKCYYCNSNSTGFGGCQLYPAQHVFPNSNECALADARWGVCWVNFEALIITMSVIAGVLLIAFVTGIYCCCCKSKRSSIVDGTSIKWERETREREQRHADRRAEREAKMTTIRQKYGLNQEGSSYSRMA